MIHLLLRGAPPPRLMPSRGCARHNIQWSRGINGFLHTARPHVTHVCPCQPRPPYAWDGVAEVRPFGAMEKNIVEGVY